MLKRKIMEKLINWKNNKDKMCLILKGPRQVGKTYIVNKFAEENYKNYIYINFYEHPELSVIFDGSLNVDDILAQIKLRINDAVIETNETLLFLDEIQECPNAITALKFFTIDKRIDVIASGSMLGIDYKEVKSHPVGYVNHMELYSLDFEEFCWANGVTEDLIKYVKTYFDDLKEVPPIVHEKMLDLFKEYIVVGGMPKVVNEFVSTHDYNKVLEIQKEILEDYKSDIAKYASGSEKVKARECFLSIPKHLACDYKKFKYSLVEKNGSAKKYGGSLMWLYEAGMINFCYNLKTPSLPLEGNARNDAFKVYMRDTGLLMALLENGSQTEVIDGNLGIYKGAIYENVIADLLAKKEYKLYYFEYNSTLEIDFFIRFNGVLTAIEVKSADNTKSKSLNSVIDNWGVKQGIKLSTKNIGYKENIINYPLYMIMFL